VLPSHSKITSVVGCRFLFFFFLYSWYRYPFPVLCITRVYTSNNVKQNKHYFIVTFILSIGIFFFVRVCEIQKKGLFFCPDYRCRGGAIAAAAAMCDCGQNAAYALITATSVSSHPVNEHSSDEPIINQLVHRPNGFRLYYSLALFFIPRPVPHKYRVCVFIFYVMLTVRRLYIDYVHLPIRYYYKYNMRDIYYSLSFIV